MDPSEHNVDEVVAYIEEHPDEANVIITAEREGKGRKGILALGEAGEISADKGERRMTGLDRAQQMMAENAKLLNRGKGQRPFHENDPSIEEEDPDEEDEESDEESE